EDLGAGSKKMSRERKIKDMALWSGSGNKYGKVLYKIANFYKPNKILELGTSLGIGSLYLAMANKEAKIYSVEGCAEIYNYTKKSLSSLGLSNVHLINDTFNHYLQ